MSRIFGDACLGLGIALMAGAAGAQPAAVSALPPLWKGVWQGTIGALPVHVCFSPAPYETKGVYYYDRNLRLLRLKPVGTDGEWRERDDTDKDGATWNLTGDDGELQGTWSNSKEDLPVRLTRLSASDEEIDGPCSSMAFHRPRMASTTVTSKSHVKNGERYTSWTFKPGPWLKEVEISTFTLDRPGPQIAKVNALLRASLPNADGTGEWLDCVTASVNSTGRDGSYLTTVEPVLIGKRWLAVNDDGGYYCGGAHPNNIITPRTFDLEEGSEVDPLDWFGPKAVIRKNLGGEHIAKKLTPEFVNEILGDRQFEDSECGLATEEQEYWNIAIKPGALVFSPQFPHALTACTEDFELPLARLQPWLSEEGKAVFASLPR